MFFVLSQMGIRLLVGTIEKETKKDTAYQEGSPILRNAHVISESHPRPLEGMDSRGIPTLHRWGGGQAVASLTPCCSRRAHEVCVCFVRWDLLGFLEF